MSKLPEIEALIASDALRAERGDQDSLKSLRDELGQLTMKELRQVAQDMQNGAPGPAVVVGGVTAQRNSLGGISYIDFDPSALDRITHHAHTIRVPFNPVYNAGGSENFFNEVDNYYSQLPRKVASLLRETGYAVATVHKMRDFDPSLSGTPRGYKEGESFDDAPAMIEHNTRRILMAEYVDGDNGQGELPTTNWQGSFFHEAAHALDAQTGASGMKGFREAYDKDLASMSPADKQDLDYFVQKGQAGRSETFAELFALLNGAQTYDDELFKRAFPNSAAAERAFLKHVPDADSL